LGELYFKVLRSKSSTIKHRSRNAEGDDADEKGPYFVLREMEKGPYIVLTEMEKAIK